MNSDVSPMQSAHDAPRCTAKAKTTGNRCNAPARCGWQVCRMHGAGGGAKPGKAHPNYRHGGRSQEAVIARAIVNALSREGKQTIERLIDD